MKNKKQCDKCKHKSRDMYPECCMALHYGEPGWPKPIHSMNENNNCKTFEKYK